MIERIKSAQKYVLAPQFAAVADELSNDFTGLVKAFPFCRLPYPETWFEVVHTDRPKFAGSTTHSETLQAAPSRIGFLCSATRDDMSAWKAHLFWNFLEVKNLGCCGAGMAIQLDMLQELDDLTESDIADNPPPYDPTFFGEITAHPGWVHSKNSIRLALHNHTSIVFPDYGAPDLGVDNVALLGPNGLADFGKLYVQLARSDWAGEIAFLLATIGLINARNAVEKVPVNQVKLNRARVKRGQTPLLDHHVLKIHVRQERRVARETGDSSNIKLRGHFVAGHFKARKSGVYFWRPFARGDFTKGTVFKSYQVNL